MVGRYSWKEFASSAQSWGSLESTFIGDGEKNKPTRSAYGANSSESAMNHVLRHQSSTEVQCSAEVEREGRGLCRALQNVRRKARKSKGELRQIGDGNLVFRGDELRTSHSGAKASQGQGWGCCIAVAFSFPKMTTST